jgi:hypothetical protein
MLLELPGALRYLPRARPGTGPTSKREVALQAEMRTLATRLLELEREQAIQFTRIAHIQRQLDEMQKLLEKIAR